MNGFGSQSYFGQGGFQPPASPALGQVTLGQASQSLYSRGQAAVDGYESELRLWSSLPTGNPKDSVAQWLGDMQTPGSPSWAYGQALSDLRKADAQTPPDLSGYQDPASENRISALEAVNLDFQAKVDEAQKEAPPSGASSADWTTPAIVAAIAIVIGLWAAS